MREGVVAVASLGILAEAVGGADLDTGQVRAVVTDGVVDMGGALGGQRHAGDTVLIERIECPQGFGGQFIHTADTERPERRTDAHVGAAIPVYVRVAAVNRSVIQVQTMFQLEHRLVTVAEVFHSPETKTAFIVVRHVSVFSGLFGDAGIDDPVDGDV